MIVHLPAQVVPGDRLLTATEVQRLTGVPPEVGWFANLTNPSTRRVHENAICDFVRFTGIVHPEECRTMRIYDHRRTLPDDSSTFKAAY